MSNNPGGRLWVDPDGVEGLGKAYESHVQLYESYLEQLAALRARYANAWGDDDMGEEFSTAFLKGMDNLEAIIGGVKGALQYTAAGLQEGGQAYRTADEAAAEVSWKMAKDFDDLNQPAYVPQSGAADQGLRPTAEGQPAQAAPPAPHPVVEPVTIAAQPAISSYVAHPEYATAYIDGAPLSGQYRLIALIPFADGSTRVDANLYDSITPLAGTPVTTPDGTPIDPGQGRFFVVKENPAVDPTLPGYQPLYLSYSPDGTPTPILPGV